MNGHGYIAHCTTYIVHTPSLFTSFRVTLAFVETIVSSWLYQEEGLESYGIIPALTVLAFDGAVADIFLWSSL